MTGQYFLFDPPNRGVTLKNRRYLGNKYRLLSFIDSVIAKHCTDVKSFADIFAGTGVVASLYPNKKIITNDLLYSNYLCHVAWFGDESFSSQKINDCISEYNQYDSRENNYMSENFSETFFNEEACQKIGIIREQIEQQFQTHQLNFRERAILITSLLYAMDKIANTCGHYDAYRRGIESAENLYLRVPTVFDLAQNIGNQCFNEDANHLVHRIQADLFYLDPPYNSRQYSDAYHLLENVARWEKPAVWGVARKMDRSNIKSRYCTRGATAAFRNLIGNIQTRYILVSYNDMGENGDGRSQAKITDHDILAILSERGSVSVFTENYKSFTTGKSNRQENKERLFLVSIRE